MKVLILKEKHGDVYFAAPVDKEGVVMLHVVKKRHKSGWYDTVEGEEWELLQKCIRDDDFTAAIDFFRLRQNAEYEDWDLVDAHILPGAQYAYSPLPIGCRARFVEIGDRAEILMETFIQGNRKSMLEDLVNMEPKTALAILAEIMCSYDREHRVDLQRFLKEMA